ncbi:MAG: marine proteobacterial sortase target protein [Gammaproteobacteria bacterium]|nr:marine proteobacterial sortase target protein [Gammaproteobacteria bacterium]
MKGRIEMRQAQWGRNVSGGGLRERAPAWWAMVVALALVMPWPSFAQPTDETAVTPAGVQTGSLLLRMKSGYVVATRLNTDIGINVSGIVSRVSLKQSFRNDGASWVEGVYVFPLPDEAAVDHMRMWVGERFIEGEIREKEKAKKEYEAAKVAGKKASLVEQQRANLFTTSVANIAPGETVTIEIEYLETVRYDDNAFSMRIPLTLTPRFIPGRQAGRQGSGWSADTDRVPDASLITPPMVTASADHKVTLNAVINAGVPLQDLESRYHPIRVSGSGTSYSVSLGSDKVPMDHDLELVWRPVPDASPRAMLFSESINGNPYYLMMVLPPADAAVPTVVLPREMIFVIDTSSSMHGTSIEQARQSLQLALDGLRSADRFNVIQFNSTASYLFPAAVDATRRNLERARNYVDRLQANGGTNMRPALRMALNAAEYPSHLRQVIFITDGSVGNEAELFTVIENDLGDARLFTVGIGSAPNGWFMRKSAEVGRGTYTFISALHEVNEKMTQLFNKLESPQVTDIEVMWPSGVVTEAYPERVADLYAGEPVMVRAKMTGYPRSGDIVSVRGDSAMGGWQQVLGLADNQASHGVAALWAHSRIEELLESARRGADADATRSAVIDTALEHHLVSKYTSLVAVDKTPVRPVTSNLDSEQVPNLLPHGQSQQAIFGFPATATSAPVQRLIGILCLLLALTLLLVRRQRLSWAA